VVDVLGLTGLLRFGAARAVVDVVCVPGASAPPAAPGEVLVVAMAEAW
jgi:hypothetical protein